MVHSKNAAAVPNLVQALYPDETSAFPLLEYPHNIGGVVNDLHVIGVFVDHTVKQINLLEGVPEDFKVGFIVKRVQLCWAWSR